MPNTIDWVEIQTSNIEAAGRFYQELFGWKEIERQVVGALQVRILDTCGEPRSENLRRAGIVQAKADSLHGVVVYIKVDSLDATLEKAVRLGAKVVAPKMKLPGGYSASFIDPDGNLMALYEDSETMQR